MSYSSVLKESRQDTVVRPKSPTLTFVTLKAYVQSLRPEFNRIFADVCCLMERSEEECKRDSAFSSLVVTRLSALCHVSHNNLRETQALTGLAALIEMTVMYVDEGHAVITEKTATDICGSIYRVTSIGMEGTAQAAPTRGGSTGLRGVEEGVRMGALFLLAALSKFPKAVFPHWSVMFPEVDGTKYGTRHPLITPFLFDVTRVRIAASCAIGSILEGSTIFLSQASEVQAKRQNFSAYSSRIGAILEQVHTAIVTGVANSMAGRGGSTGDPSVRALYVRTLAVVARSTPYGRCPSSERIMMKFASGDALRQMINSDSRVELPAALTFMASYYAARHQCDKKIGAQIASAGGTAVLERVIAIAPTVPSLQCFSSLAKSHPDVVDQYWPKILAKLRLGAQSNEESVRTETLLFVVMFFGNQWKTFDADTITPSNKHPLDLHARANSQQRVQMLEEVVFRLAPADSSVNVRCAAQKCLSQVGIETFANDPQLASTFQRMIEMALLGSTDASEDVRATAMHTIGVWGFQCLAQHEATLRDKCLAALCSGAFSKVATTRQKALWGLGNFGEMMRQATHPPGFATIRLTLQAALAGTHEAQLRPSAARTLGHLICLVNEDDLISELDGHPEGVANAVLGTLTTILDNRDHKTRWNTAYAIGEALSCEAVFFADPPAYDNSIRLLMRAALNDPVFKVRSRAVNAIGRCPNVMCFGTSFPFVVDSVCTVINSGRTTQEFDKYNELQYLLEVCNKVINVLWRRCYDSMVAADCANLAEWDAKVIVPLLSAAVPHGHELGASMVDVVLNNKPLLQDVCPNFVFALDSLDALEQS